MTGSDGEACVTAMDRPPIEPIEPAFKGQYHSAEQLDRLKQATLDILETVGVRFQSPKALDLLAQAGAGVDRATEVAKLPPDLVLEAMATAPRRFALGARDASCDIAVGDGHTYCTTDGCGVEIIDFETRRAPPVDEGRPGGRHPAAGHALEHLVLVADAQRRRTAARRRSCTSSTPAGTTPSSTCRVW